MEVAALQQVEVELKSAEKSKNELHNEDFKKSEKFQKLEICEIFLGSLQFVFLCVQSEIYSFGIFHNMVGNNSLIYIKE